jgi:hypothetical protein
VAFGCADIFATAAALRQHGMSFLRWYAVMSQTGCAVAVAAEGGERLGLNGRLQGWLTRPRYLLP